MNRRLKRIILLARCIVRNITLGKADKIPENISRIIVVPTGKLGDVVCCTPVLSALRVHMPQAKIIVAGNAKLHRAVLADSGLVDEYIDLDAPGGVARIKNAQANIGIVTGPAYEYVASLCAAGIPLVSAPTVTGGFSPSETRPYKILKKYIKTYPYDIFAYAPGERLKSLESVGTMSHDTKKHLGFSHNAKNKVLEFLKSNHITPGRDFIVAISPTAGNKIKEWPEERFAGVADHLIETHQAKVILLGGPNDTAVVQKTNTFLKHGRAVEATHFSVDELKAFISRINLFVAVDTGPIYIAEAFSIPTVDLVGPVDERVQPPIGFIHRNVVPQREKAELYILNARAYDIQEAQRQTLSVSVSDVNAVVDGLISDLKSKGLMV